jgi:hypothetical protein
MFEQAINKVTTEATDQLDLLKAYMTYYITFKVERELYMKSEQCVYDSAMRGFVGGAVGATRLPVLGFEPMKFELLIKQASAPNAKILLLDAIILSTADLERQIEALGHKRSALYIGTKFIQLVDGHR